MAARPFPGRGVTVIPSSIGGLGLNRYSAKQVLLYCLGTVALTILCLAVFRVTLWPIVENTLGMGPARVAWIGDARSSRIAERRHEELVALLDLQISVEEQHRMMTLFHQLGAWGNVYWLGVRTQKNPMDMWVFQQIITEVRPDYVIETGTLFGGSALYFAHVLEGLRLPDAEVITIDIEPRIDEVSTLELWQQRVQFIHGSSTDPEVVSRIAEQVRGKKVMVTLDSDHRKEHVLQELQSYGPLVSPGSYIVVEDTNMDGIPLYPDFGPGPMAAVEEFLKTDVGSSFEVDRSREAFVMTFNPGGWLKRAR